jgi:hypothetical protein
MRWTILAVIVAISLIIDRLNYSGNYRHGVISAIEKGAARITAWFR